MAEKPETRFRNNVVRPFIKTLKNTWVVSVQQQAIRGTPDLLLCCSGRFVALELKAKDGRATELQQYTLTQIQRAGGVAKIVSPENWSFIKSLLTNLDKGEHIK